MGGFLLVAALMIAGCGYRFTVDSGTRLSAGQTVWVPYFKNATVYANASVALKRAIFDQFVEQRGIMPSASPDLGDLILEGTLLILQKNTVLLLQLILRFVSVVKRKR
ncbi:hypothetical protein JZU51_00910 [bacterium]|nr:hypothetical protein [bacterium]